LQEIAALQSTRKRDCKLTLTNKKVCLRKTL